MKKIQTARQYVRTFFLSFLRYTSPPRQLLSLFIGSPRKVADGNVINVCQFYETISRNGADSLEGIPTICLFNSVSIIHFSAFHDSSGGLDPVPGTTLIRMKFPLFPLALFFERYHFHWYLHLLSLLPNDTSSFVLQLRTPGNRRGSFYP